MLDIAGDLVNRQSVKQVRDNHGCRPPRLARETWAIESEVSIDQWDMDLSTYS